MRATVEATRIKTRTTFTNNITAIAVITAKIITVKIINRGNPNRASSEHNAHVKVVNTNSCFRLNCGRFMAVPHAAGRGSVYGGGQ